MYCVWQTVKTPTIISNSPVFSAHKITSNDVDRTYGTYGGEILWDFWWGNQSEISHLWGLDIDSRIILKFVKVNQSHYRPEVSRGFQEIKFPSLLDNGPGWWYRCQPFPPTAFYPQEILLVLISVRGWVDPRTIVRSEGFYINEKFQWNHLESNQRPSDL